MIQNNCRIDASNGIRFFDQDILIDDFVYNDYAEVELTIAYNTPGFGIVLFNNATSALLSSDSETFLFRIGYREASIEYKTGYLNRTILSIPTTIYPGIHNDNIKVKFRKYRRNIYLDVDGTSVFDTRLYKLPKDISKFCIGIYSNAGNVIKYIQSNSKIPDYWSINMYNTIGGRIKFFNDGFEISECNEKAEIEQMKIDLPAGKFYLHYKLSEKNDIKCYAFTSNDTLIKDADKNILDYSDNSITLENDTEVNIKFVGTYGTVSEIILNQDKDSGYVYTTDDNKEVAPSNITINKNNISKVVWSAVITSFGIKEEAYLFKDGKYSLKEYSGNKTFKFGRTYQYTYDLETNKFDISYNDDIEFTKILNKNDIDKGAFSILKNVDATLFYLTIYEKDGTITNIITDNVKKISVPFSRRDPIIVTDEYDEPLNISSAYRIYTVFKDGTDIIDYDNDKYVFTNIEREIYPVNTYNNYKTQFDISENINAVRVYGITNETIDYDNIYRVINHVDDIGLCCDNNYKQIDSSEVVISRLTNEIVINSDTSEFSYIVIDYLKDQSYCINPNFDKDTYDIEISSSSKLKYYFAPNSSAVMSDYKVLSFDNFGNDSYYLCIRKEV